MRKELELMETIEKYIQGQLSKAERIAFESKMNADPTLKKEVELQQELMKGIERAGLKQSTKQALKKYKLNKNLRSWGLTGLTIAIVAASTFFIYTAVSNKQNENAAHVLPELNEQGKKEWSDADKYLPLQSFELDAQKDTVVETKDGIVIAIPANSFLDANGNPAKGKIKLEVKEALKAPDIMKAGLNTRSGDKLLETGGMFYINARQADVSLKIDPAKPLAAEIPANEVKPGMQLFEGKRLPDGSIDWINPKPVEKNLLPADILSLDFYPPDYLPALKDWGYNIKDKKFTDSLYYSFASLFGVEAWSEYYDDFYEIDSTEMVTAASLSNVAGRTPVRLPVNGADLFYKNCSVCHSLGKNKITGPGLEGVLTRVPGKDWMHQWIKNNNALIKSGDPYAVKISKFDASSMTIFTSLSDNQIDAIVSFIERYNGGGKDTAPHFRGINPATIKAIRNEKFQNTLLATREFEERLPYIHRTCSQAILDLYINNLDKNLSAIDSMVAMYKDAQGGSPDNMEAFAKFAARGEGKVKNGNTNVRLLKSYYEQKAKLYTEVISKTANEFWKNQSEKDREALKQYNARSISESSRGLDNLFTEYNLNVAEAYRQLGKEKPSPIPPAVYSVDITSTGWNNLDKYVFESTQNKTTLNYTDPQSGKKAVISYEPLNVSVNDYKSYDRVLVYLLPDDLNSFMRVKNTNEKFEENLDELMLYKLVCIGYKGEKSFYFSQDNVKPGTMNVSLIKSTNADIQNNVSKFGKPSQVKAMHDELKFIDFEKSEEERKELLSKLTELTEKVKPVIFPCMAAVPAMPPTADTIVRMGATRALGPK